MVLSHRNVLSNVHQIDQHVELLPDEVVLGILPFFHSFGFTVTIWTVLCLGKRVVYHFNPLDARIIGDLCEKHGVTMIVGTPTFMRTYLQRCEPKQFETLVHLLARGREAQARARATRSARSSGIEPLEGYGCTELSPVVAVNVPHDDDARRRPDRARQPAGDGRDCRCRARRSRRSTPRPGPTCPAGTEGMILVKGPQVMVGYLNRPEATAKVLKDGWYTTGDLGFVDADGFLKITDRLSRFSKIGGEMVPHMAVESAIQEAAGANEHGVAVTAAARPQARRAALRALHRAWALPPDEV